MLQKQMLSKFTRDNKLQKNKQRKKRRTIKCQTQQEATTE